jgi:hypothetical protein
MNNHKIASMLMPGFEYLKWYLFAMCVNLGVVLASVKVPTLNDLLL